MVLMSSVCEQSLEGRKSIFDVIKAVAILMVVVTHFPWTPAERLHYAFPFWIDTAMPIFMLLSGYLCFCSFYKKKLETFGEVYKLTYLYKRLARFVVPFVLLIPLDILCGMYGPNHASFANCLFRIIVGGHGPGSYYVPMMLQFVVVFPIVYLVIRRYGVRGLMTFILFNFLYECSCSAFGIHSQVYRICLLRHLGVVALGAFAAYLTVPKFTKHCKVNVLICGIVMCLSGAFYLYLVYYEHYNPIVFSRWKSTSLVSSLYIVGAFYFLLGRNEFVRNSDFVGWKVLASMGGMTYEVYLIQKLFYASSANKILNLRLCRGLELLCCVICCLVLGLVYHRLLTSLSIRNTKKLFYDKVKV